MTRDINPDRGPKFRCKNGDCVLIKPKSVVKETERKTLYRCPECSHILHVDWHDGEADETAETKED